MATWPHENTKLSDAEKKAYRNLLYWAMLDIRTLCQSRGRISYSPFFVWRQYRQGRVAGRLADWLHNLAQTAATDFDHFDTEWFWREYDGLFQQSTLVGAGHWMDYRKRYEDALAKQSAA